MTQSPESGSTQCVTIYEECVLTFNSFPPSPTFIARPVVGGMFAELALQGAPSSGIVQPS